MPNGGRALDVGCATGLLPKMLRDAGFEATGIELNATSAVWGSRAYGITIQVGGIEDIGGRYDLITLTDVLEHTPHPLRALVALREHLTGGGHVLVTFPDIHSLEAHYFRLLSRLFKRDWLWVSCHIPYHVWEFTPATARAVFSSAGFSVKAYRRSNRRAELEGKAKLLAAPARLLALAPSLLGGQMEFILSAARNTASAGPDRLPRPASREASPAE